MKELIKRFELLLLNILKALPFPDGKRYFNSLLNHTGYERVNLTDLDGKDDACQHIIDDFFLQDLPVQLEITKAVINAAQRARIENNVIEHFISSSHKIGITLISKGKSIPGQRFEILQEWPISEQEQDRRIKEALLRIDLINDRNVHIEKTEIRSGIYNESIVLFINLPEGLSLVAKFDHPKRADSEWKNILQLARMGCPIQFIQPLTGLLKEYGVIIYRNAEGLLSTSNKVYTIKDFVEDRLENSPEQCLEVFNKGISHLRFFYIREKGALRDGKCDSSAPLKWKDFFGYIGKSLNVIIENTNKHCPGIDWKNSSSINVNFLTGLNRDMLNPLFQIKEKYLEEKTGTVFISRIHNDLNLTNLLACTDLSGHLLDTLIIDFANTLPNELTVRDFARLEIELWHDIFCPVFTSKTSKAEMLSALICLREILDGRNKFLPEKSDGFTRNFAQLISSIRNHALCYIRGHREDIHCINEYFNALYFSCVWALRSRRIENDDLRYAAMIINAAMSLECLTDLNHGRYRITREGQFLSPFRKLT